MKIFSVDKYLAAPPADEGELLDEMQLRRLEWQPVNDAGVIFWHDGDRMGVQKVRDEWCEEIGPVALDVICEVVRQKEEAVAMASDMSRRLDEAMKQVLELTKMLPAGAAKWRSEMNSSQ